MRTMHLIARHYNPHAKAFISLTHYWTQKASPHFYPSRDLLELLLEFSRAEGDFDWAIAHHPYPESLRNPRTWEEKHSQFSFNTPQITFKNIEVLEAWVRQTKTFYLGTQRRTVHLTEQGPNSPDYSEKALVEQAAAMAYLWMKLKRLDICPRIIKPTYPSPKGCHHEPKAIPKIGLTNGRSRFSSPASSESW